MSASWGDSRVVLVESSLLCFGGAPRNDGGLRGLAEWTAWLSDKL